MNSILTASALWIGLCFWARAQDPVAKPPIPAVSPAPSSAESALTDDLPVVQAAALHQQTLQEAPANVTVISRSEIRKYGYRTLGEALDSVRGFYTSCDRIYKYVGLSGLSLPGDFNTRFLVMINGRPMTEHAYDSNNFFDQDFGLDMDLVERGLSSALYGSNAVLATINVTTRSPVDATGLRVSTEGGSLGERKLMISDALYLGEGANLLTRGLVPPAEFIPLAKDTGLILPLATLVLREACHQMRQWQIGRPHTAD